MVFVWHTYSLSEVLWYLCGILTASARYCGICVAYLQPLQGIVVFVWHTYSLSEVLQYLCGILTASARYCGICVVFPDPVSPSMIST